jgi:predicted membrane-bound spermidine synthase
MKKKLLFLSFAEGAAVMVAELCGARLLAPIFGSSLYVWSSVMGITLGALAGGYFYGGQLAAKPEPGKKLCAVMNLAALLVMLLPVISFYIVPRISYLPLIAGIVTSTFLLLFFPVFFLGASSPLLIILQTRQLQNAGKVSGTIYAVSTLGGIMATFLCGFYLIPAIGLNACLLISGGILLLASLLVFWPFKFGVLLPATCILYLNYQFMSAESNGLRTSEGILGRLEISDENNRGHGLRYLKINSIIQSEMDLSTHKSVSPYVTIIDSIVHYTDTAKAALVLGLGAGLTANLLEEKNFRTDGVEFDSRIIDAAKDFFFLNPKVKILEADARFFLNGCKKKYDVILADLFKAEEQPSHILTAESLEHLKRNLAPGGILLINWHGYLNGDTGTGSAILVNTLINAGYQVRLCATNGDESHRNIIFVGSLHTLGNLPYEIAERPAPSRLVNSDNYPMLERYNATANKLWRTSYLRYYQGS